MLTSDTGKKQIGEIEANGFVNLHKPVATEFAAKNGANSKSVRTTFCGSNFKISNAADGPLSNDHSGFLGNDRTSTHGASLPFSH